MLGQVIQGWPFPLQTAPSCLAPRMSASLSMTKSMFYRFSHGVEGSVYVLYKDFFFNFPKGENFFSRTL